MIATVVTAVIVLVGLVALGIGLFGAVARVRSAAIIALIASPVLLVLGLAGTVIGLFVAFDAVATIDPSQKAVVLAEGIETAMNATAAGLVNSVVVGIVGLIAVWRSPPRSEAGTNPTDFR